MLRKLKACALLMRFDKLIGVWLLLWPTLWGLWAAADGLPPISIVIIFLLGTVVMRAAGCVANDLADRRFDGDVERTKTRPLVNGSVSTKEAVVLLAILLFIAFALVLFLNAFAFKLAFIGAFLALVYPFMKRFIHAPQLVLGFAFSWGIPLAFAAIQNTVPPIAWWLYAAAILWPVAYDTMYAMVDREDDLKIGLKSTAVWFGENDCLIIAILQAVVWLMLFVYGACMRMNVMFYVCLLFAGTWFFYMSYLIKDRSRDHCFKAFKMSHWAGLIIWLGFVL